MPVVVKGLDEFRRELRRTDKRMGKAFQKANKKVSERVVSKGKPAVKNLPTPGGSIAVGGIRPRDLPTAVRLANRNGNVQKSNASDIRAPRRSGTRRSTVGGLSCLLGKNGRDRRRYLPQRKTRDRRFLHLEEHYPIMCLYVWSS